MNESKDALKFMRRLKNAAAREGFQIANAKYSLEGNFAVVAGTFGNPRKSQPRGYVTRFYNGERNELMSGVYELTESEAIESMRTRFDDLKANMKLAGGIQ